MMWGYGEPTGWAWLVMSVSMLVFWGLVIWGIALIVRWMSRREPSARDILERRFARGELDVDDLARRLEVLEGRTRRTAEVKS